MNNAMNKILITFITIFGAVFFLSIPSTFAVSSLVVEFQDTPLFNEANFVPGESVSRWVKVLNNSGQAQRIATEAINENDLDNFASQLNLNIKEGETVIFDKTLAEFFDQGETYLSSLADGAQTQYDFTITFNSGSGNEYQEKTLGFDILVGFEGTEGGLPLPPPGGGTGGGGGGSVFPQGLTIANESVQIINTQETSVTITWTTSYFSTSQVIYGSADENHTLDLSDNSGTPPKYGYSHTTPEYDIGTKVTSHTVTVYGLTPGTTYYFRAVSHGSLAVSLEKTFTTKGVAGAYQETIAFESQNQEYSGTDFSEGKFSQPGQTGQAEGNESGELKGEEMPLAGEETVANKEFGRDLIAAIGLMPWATKTILIIALLIIIGLIILWISKRKKKNKSYTEQSNV